MCHHVIVLFQINIQHDPPTTRSNKNNNEKYSRCRNSWKRIGTNINKSSCKFLDLICFCHYAFVFQELFIKSLAKEGYKDAKQNKTLDYKNLANVVHKNDKYEFLREIVPQKITVRKYRELMTKKQAGKKGSDEGSSSDSGSSSESSDDENKLSAASKSSDSESEK